MRTGMVRSGYAALFGLMAGAGTLLAVGLPTAVIPNAWFRRMTPTRSEDYLFLGMTVALAAALAHPNWQGDLARLYAAAQNTAIQQTRSIYLRETHEHTTLFAVGRINADRASFGLNARRFKGGEFVDFVTRAACGRCQQGDCGVGN